MRDRDVGATDRLRVDVPTEAKGRTDSQLSELAPVYTLYRMESGRRGRKSVRPFASVLEFGTSTRTRSVAPTSRSRKMASTVYRRRLA